MKIQNPKFVTLLGRRWRLLFVPRLGEAGQGDDGQCDPPDCPGKAIRVRADLRQTALLETLLHEMLHACNWTHDENHVTRSAADMAQILWRLGYRRQGER